MRNAFYKYLPAVAGTLLGWFLFHPPAWLASLGPMAWGVNALLIGVLLVGLVAVVIVANLPERPKMEPVSDRDVHADLRALGDRFRSLGFRPAGPALRVHIAPAAILLGYVHESQPVYATAFRTDTAPPKVSFDFVSILHGEQGGLTTNTDPGGAALPAGPGGLRQVFPGADPEEVFRRHREGIEFLKREGIHLRAVSADMLRQDVTDAIRRQREAFLSSPLRSSLIKLWRAGTKRVPFVGTLANQKIARQQVARLLAGC